MLSPSAYDRRRRFSLFIVDCMKADHDVLIATVRAKNSCALLLRLAALRILVVECRLDGTLGLPYPQKKNLVRKHYGI